MNRKNSNRNIWALTLSLCFGVIFTHATGYAAEAKVSPAQFRSRLQGHDRQLTSIEASFTQIEAARATADKDKYADALNDTMAAYAKGMMESFDTATKQAELANKSQGKEGSIALLKQFEDLAAKHERTLKQLDARAQKMKAPPEASAYEPAEGDNGWSLLEKIGDFFISPAQAAIAVSTYNQCHQSPPNQAACAQAIVNAVTQGNAARNVFNTCWNNQESVRPKWWRAVKRAACTAVLVARLA
ncbi:MAG TPA: hypothetical protein VEP30_01170 [Chthoniobacterales bacterium]|nr:hypothetical protein [Chthoniobacterales bacterium]